jgi:hypothetical protein
VERLGAAREGGGARVIRAGCLELGRGQEGKHLGHSIFRNAALVLEQKHHLGIGQGAAFGSRASGLDYREAHFALEEIYI